MGRMGTGLAIAAMMSVGSLLGCASSAAPAATEAAPPPTVAATPEAPAAPTAAAASTPAEPPKQTEYAVRWRYRDADTMSSVESIAEALGAVKGTLKVKPNATGRKNAYSLPYGDSNPCFFRRVRETGGRKDVTIRVRKHESCKDPAAARKALKDACPDVEPGFGIEGELAFGPKGQVQNTSYSCETDTTKEPSVADVVFDAENPHTATSDRWTFEAPWEGVQKEQREIRIEKWTRDSDKDVLIEVSWTSVTSDENKAKFEALIKTIPTDLRLDVSKTQWVTGVASGN
jgi:hypothetical protein